MQEHIPALELAGDASAAEARVASSAKRFMAVDLYAGCNRCVSAYRTL